MSVVSPDLAQAQRSIPFPWLTPIACRLLFVAFGLVGFVGHLRYLTHDCPIDLTGDEAQYWDWSRHLQLGYYSKPPLVAWMIRGSCALLGNTMPAVRMPALLCSAGTTLVAYALTRKLFYSDRLALGVVGLMACVPLFIAGSVVMTIDAPLFLCWAVATWLAAIAIFDKRPWAWPLVGVAAGVGFLAKYAMGLWFVGLLIFLVAQRRRLAGLWTALAIAAMFTVPVVLWNAGHGWVSLHHVAAQLAQPGRKHAYFRELASNVGVLVGGQAGALGLGLTPIVVAACIFASRRDNGETAATRERLHFLLAIGLTFFSLNVVASLTAKVQPNWPAPAYFTLLIVTAYFLATRLPDPVAWRRWRGWLYGTILAMPPTVLLAHQPQLLYPIVTRIAAWTGRPGNSVRWLAFFAKEQGNAEMGRAVSAQLASLSPGAFVLCEDYQQTALAAFYCDGQPTCYYFGSRKRDNPGRWSQYDLWPGLEQPALLGHDAVYIGQDDPALRAAFTSVRRLDDIVITRNGVEVRHFHPWRCEGYKGMTRAARPHAY